MTRTRFRPLLAILALLTLAGTCHGRGRAPEIEILGSFFPAWMACAAGSVVLVIAARRVLLKLGWEPDARAEAVVYPALWMCFAGLLWLVFFG